MNVSAAKLTITEKAGKILFFILTQIECGLMSAGRLIKIGEFDFDDGKGSQDIHIGFACYTKSKGDEGLVCESLRDAFSYCLRFIGTNSTRGKIGSQIRPALYVGHAAKSENGLHFCQVGTNAKSRFSPSNISKIRQSNSEAVQDKFAEFRQTETYAKFLAFKELVDGKAFPIVKLPSTVVVDFDGNSETIQLAGYMFRGSNLPEIIREANRACQSELTEAGTAAVAAQSGEAVDWSGKSVEDLMAQFLG